MSLFSLRKLEFRMKGNGKMGKWEKSKKEKEKEKEKERRKTSLRNTTGAEI